MQIFLKSKKRQIKIQNLANKLLKCPICGGFLSPASSSIDHIIRKEDGGTNSIKNGQMTHLYCNTTYKETKNLEKNCKKLFKII